MKREFIEDIGTYNISDVSASDPLILRYFRHLVPEISRALRKTRCLNCEGELRGFSPVVYWYSKEDECAQWWHFQKCVIHDHELINTLGKTTVNQPVGKG